MPISAELAVHSPFHDFKSNALEAELALGCKSGSHCLL
jgi:hypothetical protein